MVSVYEEARERWTWKNQVTEEGPYGFKILSQIRRQDHGMYYNIEDHDSAWSFFVL
jgi:hypothetical protein